MRLLGTRRSITSASVGLALAAAPFTVGADARIKFNEAQCAAGGSCCKMIGSVCYPDGVEEAYQNFFWYDGSGGCP